MKIGIFDSGLGGLVIARSLIEALPQYDYVYLGDTARVPYGNRSQQIIYQFTEQAVEYLFNQGCQLVIVACNTASAEALRTIQQEYLPQQHPDRRVLGVLIPAAEVAVEQSPGQKIGVLATASTVSSGAFIREIAKLAPRAAIFQQAAPLLVPLVENNGMQWAGPILDSYLALFQEEGVDTLILGCTHYPLLKDPIREKMGNEVAVISQDELLPKKLSDYLLRHPETAGRLTVNGERTFIATDRTEGMLAASALLFQEPISFAIEPLLPKGP